MLNIWTQIWINLNHSKQIRALFAILFFSPLSTINHGTRVSVDASRLAAAGRHSSIFYGDGRQNIFSPDASTSRTNLGRIDHVHLLPNLCKNLLVFLSWPFEDTEHPILHGRRRRRGSGCTCKDSQVTQHVICATACYF